MVVFPSMGYPSLRACVDDLERNGQLFRLKDEVDPDLEMAEIQRRVYMWLLDDIKTVEFRVSY